MKRVLVVDDSRSARMIFIRCLKIVGYSEAEFLEAGNGEEALDVLAEVPDVDLVMLDLNMPKLDGLGLLQRLKRDHDRRDLPIVVASSLTSPVLRARLFAEGVHAVLEKPISPVSLIAALSGLVGSPGGDRSDADPIRFDACLDRAVSETFEVMAFTALARQRDAVRPQFEEPVIWARIALVDPAAGELGVVVGERFAQRLEETVTGAVGGEIEGRLELLGEVVNALAGRWARKLAPDGERILLGLPRTGRGDWDGEAARETATFVTDDGERILVVRYRRAGAEPGPVR